MQISLYLPSLPELRSGRKWLNAQKITKYEA